MYRLIRYELEQREFLAGLELKKQFGVIFILFILFFVFLFSASS